MSPAPLLTGFVLLALLAILALSTPLVLFAPVLRTCGVTNGNGEAGRGKHDTNSRDRLFEYATASSRVRHHRFGIGSTDDFNTRPITILLRGSGTRAPAQALAPAVLAVVIRHSDPKAF